MKKQSVISVFFSVIVLFGCQKTPDNDAQSSVQTVADLIISNAKIYTVNDKQPWAEAVAIKNDEIVFVGSESDSKAWIGDKTVIHDVDGKMVLPGFIDSHAHVVMGGAYVRSLSLDSFATPEYWVKQVKQYADENPDADILFGYGFLASAFGPMGPTSLQLDQVVADRAVYIMDEGFHGAWANTKAMELLGITDSTPDLEPGFSYYKRDNNGHATGYLLEAAATAGVEKLGIITADSIALGTGDVIKIINSYGITSVFDAGALEVADLQIEVLEKATAKGDMTIRMVASHMISSAEEAEHGVEKALAKRDMSKREMFHINTLKIMNDGTIEGKTAGMFEDYQGEPGNKGQTVFSAEQMNMLLAQVSAANMDVHIHALGERAISETLDAIALVRDNPNFDKSTSRFTLCHVQVVTDEDIKRFKQLDVIAQSTPLWASYDEFGKEFISADQFNRYFRYNSFKEAGVKMAFGSDFPASGAGTLGMSPLFNMEVGHTRQTPNVENAPVQPNINERLDIASLIKGYTLDGAYQLNMEQQIGSIEVGKKADMVVLDKNLFDVPKYDIHKVSVERTYLGAKVVYEKQ